MKWPRGKYNNQRIIGVGFKFELIINYWGFERHWKLGCRYVHIGPIILRFEWIYELTEKQK